MVTRNDVAHAAGVSSAVVSYVLNDGPRPVSAAARQRVLAAIDELGYRPNSIARFMRMQSTNSIGFILPDITLSYFAVMTQRITEIAGERGLSVIVATSSGSRKLEREHLLDLASRQVDGIILMSVDPTQDFSWAGDLGRPLLIVDRPVVAVEGMAAAVGHLFDGGCRRLARLGSSDGSPLSSRRDAGWVRALAAHSVQPSDAPVVRAGTEAVAGYSAARELLERADRPDGLVVDSPAHAMAAVRAAADLGLRSPEDVALVAIEFGEDAEFTVPRLTSVDSPLTAIAARAVDAITDASSEDRLLRLDGTDFLLTVRESSSPTD
jgi:LacI family transcriptional regulator